MTRDARIVDCARCDGLGGWYSSRWDWEDTFDRCEACGGTGEEEVGVEPVTEEERMEP